MKRYKTNFLGFEIEIEIDKKEIKRFLAGLVKN